LPDVSQIVHRPGVQHLVQGDFAGLLVEGNASSGAGGQAAQILQVRVALFLEVGEFLFGIGSR